MMASGCHSKCRRSAGDVNGTPARGRVSPQTSTETPLSRLFPEPALLSVFVPDSQTPAWEAPSRAPPSPTMKTTAQE